MQENPHYQRIAQAIAFITMNHKKQPSLEEIAEHIHLSPAHFQRLFTEWAGVSPKKFLQFTSIHHARALLRETEPMTLFDTSYHLGLSSSSRLHDLFIQVEGMTPGNYKNGGKNLRIRYQFSATPFGQVLVASTDIGVCYMAFAADRHSGLSELQSRFPNAKFEASRDSIQTNALSIFECDWKNLPQIKLHLKGSEFQLKVWESLLKIPMGKLTSYGSLAKEMGQPQASRAVGTAVGSNPVAFLIPCHRVIQSSGALGGYMWGTTRKTAMIAWESAQTRNQSQV